ncbi:MAG: winged helix-turn-helix domain-containing protein [Flavobacteriales bacterium]
MLDALITSKTRIRLLVKFFLNPAMSAYLRELAEEFGESTNAVRVELNRLSDAGILESESKGNVVLYKAKTSHPLFPEIKSIVNKYTGVDRVIEDVVQRLGKVERAYLVGDYAAGRDTGIIDLILLGEVDKSYLDLLIEKAEKIVSRRIRYLIMNRDELKRYLEHYNGQLVVMWSNEN